MAGHGRTLAILGGVLAAAVAATLWLVLSGESRDDAGAGGAAGNGADAASAAPTERAKKQGDATVFGEIRRSAGKKPVAGQEVRLAPEKGDAWTVTTDARGAFRFEHVPHGGPYELSAAAPGCGTIRIPGIALDRNEKRNVGTLYLDPSVKVTVHVRDGADAPVAGARVEAFAVTTGDDEDWSKALAQIAQTPIAVMSGTTDASGDLVFAETAVGTWTFAATKEGFAKGGAQAALVGDEEPRPVTIRLARGHPLDGRVLDSAGKPVANALVLAAAGDAFWGPAAAPLRSRTKSADDGRYAFPALASGDITLWVARDGGIAAPVVTLRIPRVAHYDVVLPAEGVLRGTVTEKGSGRPVEGALVRATSWESNQAHSGESATDAEGRYELRMAVGAVNDLTVEKDGLVQTREERPGGSDRVAVLQEGVDVVRDLRMERGARLMGVVRGDGKPLESAHVLLAVGTPQTGFTQKTAITDENGRYEYASLTKGTFLLLVTKEGWYQPGAPEQWWDAANERGKAPEFETEIPESGDAVRDLEMRRGSDVTGTVLGPDGGPLAAARVGAPGAADSAPTGADGVFRVVGVTPGPAVPFTCRRDGYCLASPAPVAVGADRETTGVSIRMSAEPHVRGTVTLRDGGAPADARVLVAVEAGNADAAPWAAAWRWMNATRVPVHADGRYDGAFALQPDGRLLVRAESDAHASADAKAVPLVAGQDAYEIDLVLEPGSSLTGRVTTPAGDPVAGADVSVAEHLDNEENVSYTTGETPPVWAVTGPDGAFEVPHLAAGRYDVRVSARGFVAAMKSVAPGEALVITLAPEMTIEGTVAFADGRALEGAEVQVKQDEATPSFGGLQHQAPTVTTDARGAFRLTGLAEGRYDVEVAAPWGSTINLRPKTVTQVAAGTRGLKITVEEGARIRGRVVDAQRRPLAGVWVEAGPASPAAAEPEDESADVSEDGEWHYATSKDDGTFEIVGLGRGPYDVRASQDGGHRPAQRENVAVGTDGVELVMEDGLAISGVLFGDEKPLANVGLWAARIAPGSEDVRTDTVRTDSQGRFTFGGLEPGAYRMSIATWGGPEQAWLIESQEPVQAGATGLRVVAVRGATVSGTIADESGRPVAGATITASSERAGTHRSARSQTDGTFEVAGLPRDGKLTVRASAGGRAGTTLDGVEAGATGLRIVLVAALSTKGRVTLADGKPAARTAVLLTTADGKTTVHARTDANGAFSADGLAEGSYVARVWVAKSGSEGDWKECGTVRAGDTSVELRLQE